MNKNFKYGIASIKFKDFLIGYIEKNSFDLGGQKGDVTKIEGEQVPGTPVLVILQSNGTISPTFNVIQVNYENMQNLLGGYLHYKTEDSEKKNPIGWTAPKELIQLEGPWQIDLVSGSSILIPKALLLADFGGKLTLTETSKIECSLEPSVSEDGGQPYGIFDTENIPEEWKQYKLPAAPQEEDS